MPDNKKILDIAAEKYMERRNDIETKINLSKELEYKFKKTSDNDIVQISDGNKTITAEYEYLGMWSQNQWTWAWNNPFVNKKLILISEKIHEYADYIKKHYETFDKEEVDSIYYFVKHGNFFATEDVVNLIVKLSLYLSQCKWCFKFGKHYDEYIIITKIIQY
jgi:hypothetical protein